MAKPLEIKVWSKREHSLQQHDGRCSQGGIQCSRGKNKCLCSDSWKSKIKASKPCEFVLGKKVEQLQRNPGKNHPLFLMLLHSCHHEKLHRLKWRTTHHWAVLICCWMLTRWQRRKYEMFLFVTFYNTESHFFIFLSHFFPIFFPYIPNALDLVAAKASAGWGQEERFLLLLIL